MCRTEDDDARHAATAHLQALRALHAVTKQVHASLDLPSTLDAVASGVVAAAGFGIAVVNLILPSGEFEVVSVVGDDDARDALMGSVQTAQYWRHVLEHSDRVDGLHFVDHRSTNALSEDELSWIPDVEVSDDPDAWHPLDGLFVPLTSPQDEWIGVLSVDLPVGGRRPGPEQCEILALFADQAAIAITHARLHDALRERELAARHAATHDPLTGLANRALLADAAAALTALPGTHVAAVVVDLDGFKAVNDRHGHSAGDEVLRLVAQRLQACVRDTDVLARTGGDEFVVLVGGPDAAAAAQALVRRLAAVVAEPLLTAYGPLQVGASVGVASLSTPVSPGELLALADVRMYADKRSRRACA